MTKRLSLIVGALVCALNAGAVRAEVLTYQLTLTGAKEAPPNGSAGSGTAILTVDTVQDTLRLQLSFAGLSGDTTAAHLHCCTASPLAGTAGVATTTPSFAGFPLGVTAGSMDQTYDMTLASSFNAAFITANGGTTSSAWQVLRNGIASGNAYLNVHTSAFRGGEIRSFATVVPEPASWALMSLGALVLASRARKPAARPATQGQAG